MPELRECIASHMLASWGFQHFLHTRESSTCTVQQIYYDLTTVEGNATPNYNGLPRTLTTNSSVRRGSGKAQTPLAPTVPFCSLVLRSIETTYRALILDFTVAYFQIQYLQHTSVQWYSIHKWDNAIMNISHEERGFRIAIAFRFCSHVLAFVSADNLFQPNWSPNPFLIPITLDGRPHDFLCSIADWIDKHAFGMRIQTDRLACVVIREHKQVFHGIGAYTVIELFFIAGLSPFLSVRELFQNPSRTARFISALYAFTMHAKSTFWSDLIKPSLHDGILAPTSTQRLRFVRWLHIWAKERIEIPARTGLLIDEYNSAMAINKSCPNDPFEPSYILSALSINSNLGHLIFGRDRWSQLRGDYPMSIVMDPLTTMYQKKLCSVFQKPDTHLSETAYSSLLPNGQTCWRTTMLFRPRNGNSNKSKQKQIWTLVKPRAGTTNIELVSEKDRQVNLFNTIVDRTLRVSIGPLEYVGNGHLLRCGKQTWVAACKNDPTVPEHLEEQYIHGLERKSGSNWTPSRQESPKKRLYPFNARGVRHRGRTYREKCAFKNRCLMLLKRLHINRRLHKSFTDGTKGGGFF